MTVKIKRNDIQQAEQVGSIVDENNEVLRNSINLINNSVYEESSYEIRNTEGYHFYFGSYRAPSFTLGGNNIDLGGDLSDITKNSSFSRFKITVESVNLDADCRITIRPYVETHENGSFRSGIRLYESTDTFLKGSGIGRYKIFQPIEGGTSGEQGLVVIPALDDITPALCITIRADSTPTSGEVKVGVRAQ